jgi:hypothetical protein
MTMERALFEKLKSANLVADDKIYALRAKQGDTGPFIIYQRISSERWRHINGPTGMVQAMMQIDIYTGDYNETKALALQVETLLDGFRGTVAYGGDSPRATLRFGGISLQNDVDIFDQTDEPFLCRVSQDYLITYEQS